MIGLLRAVPTTRTAPWNPITPHASAFLHLGQGVEAGLFPQNVWIVLKGLGL